MKGFDELTADEREKLADNLLHKHCEQGASDEECLDCAVLRQMAAGKSEAEARSHIAAHVPTLRERIQARREFFDNDG